MTHAAPMRSDATSLAVSKPSSAGLAAVGGVKTSPGSPISPTSPATRPWVARNRTEVDARSAAFRFDSVAAPAINRSEEHTSELQSLMRISYAVFCLKKKKKQHTVQQ